MALSLSHSRSLLFVLLLFVASRKPDTCAVAKPKNKHSFATSKVFLKSNLLGRFLIQTLKSGFRVCTHFTCILHPTATARPDGQNCACGRTTAPVGGQLRLWADDYNYACLRTIKTTPVGGRSKPRLWADNYACHHRPTSMGGQLRMWTV